jgi:hypothetical protein
MAAPRRESETARPRGAEKTNEKDGTDGKRTVDKDRAAGKQAEWTGMRTQHAGRRQIRKDEKGRTAKAARRKKAIIRVFPSPTRGNGKPGNDRSDGYSPAERGRTVIVFAPKSEPDMTKQRFFHRIAHTFAVFPILFVPFPQRTFM